MPVDTLEMPLGHDIFVPGRDEIANFLSDPPGVATLEERSRLIRRGELPCVITFYDIPSGKELSTVTLQLNGKRCPIPPEFVPHREGILAGRDFHAITFWDLRSGKLIREIAEDRWIRGMAFSPDGKWVFAPVFWGSRDILVEQQDFKIWDVESGAVVYATPLRVSRPWENTIPSGRFSSDGRYLAVEDNDGITLYEITPDSAGEN